MGAPEEAVARRPAKAAPKENEAQLAFRDYILGDQVRARLVDVASKYLAPEDIMRCVLVAASRKPRLLDCTRDSVLRCMMDAALIGVRPGGTMGRGWLIPRYNKRIRGFECTFDPGYRGLSDVARRSGAVRRIEARVVHALDIFRVLEGSDPSIDHEPYDGGDWPGEVRASYAIAVYSDGGRHFEVVWKRDLDKIMEMSENVDEKGKLVGPWVDWYDEMAKKSAVRRLCKHLPATEELDYALELATRAERVKELPDAAAAPALGEARARTLGDQIRARGAANVPRDKVPSDPSMRLGDDPAGLGAK